MKNKWKIAFLVCLLLLALTVIFGLYSTMDQAVSLSYMKEGYSDTVADLETLIEIIEQTDQTKAGIIEILKNHRLHSFMDFKKDTIAIERLIIIFENDTVKKIEKQW